MALFILALILFVIFDILIRYIGRRMKEKKAQQERAKALEVSLKLDYSLEAKTLKRVEVQEPKAKILCVDDEPVILDSFRKILVLDGYSVDTVEKGEEALGLIQTHHYDFLFLLEILYSLEHLDSRHLRHIEVRNDQVVIVVFQKSDSLPPGGCRVHAVPVFGQHNLHEIAHGIFIINNQYFSRHKISRKKRNIVYFII